MKASQLVALSAAFISTIAMAQIADDSILADEYIISQEFIEAEVVRVQPVSRKLVVRGTKRGQTREFSVPEGTRITVEGRTARLQDIRRGDTVLLAMTPQAEEVVISRVRVPETDTPLEQRQATPAAAEPMPTVLPKTASSWPVVFMTGMLAVFAAGAIRLGRRYL